MSSSPSRKRQKLGTDGAPASTVPAAPAGSGRPAKGHAKEPSTADTSSVEGAPTLPPTVWGHVLDYLLYGEVRQAILVNKTLANEASKFVEEIFVTKPCQLDVVAARRFPNVDYVQIRCLLRWTDKDTCVLSPETATKVVPFLSNFPKLDQFFIGDCDASKAHGVLRLGYCPKNCITHDHQTIMRDLTKSFCAAFRSRALSQEMFLGGLSGHFSRTHMCQPGSALEGFPCDLCREILLTFPPSFVRKLLRWDSTFDDLMGSMSDICMTRNDYVLTLKSRRFEDNFFKDNGKDILLTHFELMRYKFRLDQTNPKNEKVIRRFEKEGVRCPKEILYFGGDDVLDTISAVIRCGFDPKQISKEEIYNAMELEGRTAMFADDLDKLCNMGLPFDRNDFSIVHEDDVVHEDDIVVVVDDV